MSINEIVNYVNRTPHNTNPSVIASMVQGVNEQAVYESVEELKRSGGVGYSEKKVFTFDGNIEGKDTVEFEGMKLYQIANEAPDLGTIVKVRGVLHGQTIEVSGDEFETDSDSVGDVTFVIAYWKGSPFAVSAIADEISALYVHPGLRYIEFEGTVHTIDPKYLPEEAYPKRIELRNYTFDSGVSLEYVVLAAYSAGGGRVSAVLDSKFWADIDTNRSLRFVIYTDMAGAKGGEIEIDVSTVLRMNGVPMQVNCEAVFNFNGNYTRLRITISKGASNSNGATIAVSVEPMAWPDLTE